MTRTLSAAHDEQQADNPLWYDYVELDEPPGRLLMTLAGMLNVAIDATNVLARFYWRLDRLWRRATRVLASLQKI